MTPVLANSQEIAVLIVAAGKGTRSVEPSVASLPKQYRLLAGKAVISRTLSAFLHHSTIRFIQCVIGDQDAKLLADAIGDLPKDGRLLEPVTGGSSRQASVLAGLAALERLGFAGTVMVHDAARPFVAPALIERAIAMAGLAKAAIPVLPIVDTIKRRDATGSIATTLPREGLVTVQTPQVFDFPALLQAHRRAVLANASTFTDDAAVMEWAGVTVATFAGDPANTKLTTSADFAVAGQRLGPHMAARVGQGYDVHRFMAGDHVWLGGVRIAHTMGVEAHSDGDVVLHALTDALLGALAEGDIGVHFKPSDERWRGAASDQFLAHAVARLAARGGSIANLDVTVVCEEPKIGPHREAMRARIAAICGIGIGRVSIKATTSEQMGFTGRREGLSASAIINVLLPDEVH